MSGEMFVLQVSNRAETETLVQPRLSSNAFLHSSSCTISMNHIEDGVAHFCNQKCKFNHQLDNRVFYCRECNERGEDIMVVPKVVASNESSWLGIAKYAWAGYILECVNCGVIYRSRQYWYGNRDPWETAVKTEIVHHWPGETNPSNGTQNAARRIIDGVTSISETVSTISAKPAKYVSDLVADSIAPAYWIPNSRITVTFKCANFTSKSFISLDQQCGICAKQFDELETKHHCRACGGGFCDVCSSFVRRVPEKGWTEPVRVCEKCFNTSKRTALRKSLVNRI